MFKSMADELYAVTDTRRVFLEIRYHDVDLDTLKRSALELIRFMKKMHDIEFVASWTFENKGISEKRLIETIGAAEINFDFWSEANVVTPYIYNKKTLNEFADTLKYDCHIPRGSCSEDYWDYVIENKLIEITDEDALRQSVVALFHEPAKMNLSYYNSFDLQCHFFSHKYWNKKDKYYGNLVVEIALGTIIGLQNEISKKFSDFAKEICPLMGSSNALIGISPWGSGMYRSPYMHYFGVSGLKQDGSHGEENCVPVEWYPYKYLCGAEWGSVVCELTQKHEPKLKEKLRKREDVIIEELPNKSLYIQLKKSIDKTDVQDLYVIRELLDKCLYPGESRKYDISKVFDPKEETWRLRRSWESVPIYKKDIFIDNGFLYFQK